MSAQFEGQQPDTMPVQLYTKKESGAIEPVLSEDGVIPVKVVSDDTTKQLGVDAGETCGDAGPIQQHEKEAPSYPARELLTFDTNIQAVLGTQRLISDDNKKIKVENTFPADLSVQGAMKASGNEVIINLSGHASVAFQLIGTWAGTASFFGSIDGQTWYAWSCQASLAVLSTAAISSTGNGIWQARVAGLKAFKIALTWTSGTCWAIINASQAPISYQTQVTATVAGSQGVVPNQRNATMELSTSDTAVRESLYIAEPYNSNIIYYPGDVVFWNGRMYRCILQTVLTATVSSPASATYWTVDLRPSRSLITKDYISVPDAPRIRVEIDMDGYQYRAMETQNVNQLLAIQNDMESNEKQLLVSMGQGGQYGNNFALGRSGQSAYNFQEIR